MRDGAGGALEAAYRAHWARLLAGLARRLRDLDLAEECLQDAFAAAAARWGEGPPANPAGWLTTAAMRRALDLPRRRATAAARAPLLRVEEAAPEPTQRDLENLPDERLALIFTCCHPALSPESRVALTLRLVGGLTTAEIARLFLAAEPAMAARLTRAKQKIAAAGIPFREPPPGERAERLSAVLGVIYVIFTEGYAASAGERLVRTELAEEAIRLADLVAALAPGDGEALSLAALLKLQHARRDARLDKNGEIVLLPDQDRSRWRGDEIAVGLATLTRAGPVEALGPYGLQAAIAAEHARAERATDTNWSLIAALYARLELLTGSPVVRLNRAVAVAEASGPADGLALLDGLDARLPRNAQLRLVRGELLARAGAREPAVAELRVALERAGPDPERRHVARRLQTLLNPADDVSARRS